MPLHWVQTIVMCVSLLLGTSQGWAAIALVQSATQVDVAGSSTTAPSITLNGVTAGNYLVLTGGIFDSSATLTITSTTDGTNTYTTRTGVSTGAAQRVYSVVAYAKVTASGDYTVAVNLSNTSGGANRYYVLGLQEWSGVHPTTPEDTWDANDDIDSSGAVDASAGPISTTDAGDLLVGAAVVDAVDTALNFSSPASWTNAYRQNDGNAYVGFDSGYWLPGSIQTTYTAQWSHDNGVNYRSAGVIVALKPAPPTFVGCRLLQDGTSKRLLQDGTSGRLLQGGGSGCGGAAPPDVVPVRMLMGVGL